MFGGDPVTREQMTLFMYRYTSKLGLDVLARAVLVAPDAAFVSAWAREAPRRGRGSFEAPCWR